MSKLKAKAPVSTGPQKTKAVIYGASGVGKTWFTLSFPVPYFIDCEGGARLNHYQDRLKAVGGAYMGIDDGALDFRTLVEQIEALATEKHAYRTLVIDSITKVYQTAIANEAARLGDKDAFGASKKPAVASMRQLVSWITKLDMNVWLVAHEATEWGVNPKTGMREEMDKIPDVWDKLIYELDLGLRAFRRGDQRLLMVKKSRIQSFVERDVFPLEYADFSERYGREAIESDVTPIVLATAKQVEEIERLAGVLKVDEDERQKILTKANASEWRELTTEQANKVIEFFKKKINA